MTAIPANVTILDAVRHPAIWGGWFKDAATWAAWFAFLRVLFGLPLDANDLELFRQCTGRDTTPAAGFIEAWLICGRRAGKSFILALIACYLAIFRDWRPYLSPGEIGTIKIVATDRRQARVIYRYCRALLTRVPAFASLIERDSDEEIVLTNGIVIEIQTASFRSIRGYTVIAALADEIAFWRSDETSANPDSEIIGALRPAMATIPGAMLLAASSPFARRGELWRAFRQYHCQDDAPALCWHAPTRRMNDTVPQRVIDEAMEDDPAKAAAEFLAEFRTDVETFIAREVVEAAVAPGRHELPRISGIRYVGFFDAAGGSGRDSFVSAVAHFDRATGHSILDAIRERRPPFSPEVTCQEHAAFFKSYGVLKVTADRWGGDFPAEQFRKHGVSVDVSERVKSDIYIEGLPLLNSGTVELLDNPRLVAQICGLERRTARGGKDKIDHAPGGSDDVANAALGALGLAAGKSAPIIISDAALEWSRGSPQWARI
jgi:hypothetical protein